MSSRPGLLLAVGSVLLVAVACHAAPSPTAHASRPTRAARPGERPPTLRYTATFVREPEPALDVEVLRTGRDAPREFLFSQAGEVSTVRLLGAGNKPGRDVPVSSEGEVLVPEGTRGLRYHYRLDGHGRRGGFMTGMGEGDTWHVAGRAWLLRPRTVTPSMRAQLVVEGTDALPPWSPDAEGVYSLTGADLVDSGFMGLGGRRCTVPVGDARVEVAILGRMSHLDDAALCAWVGRTAQEILTVRSTFPFQRMTVRLVGVPHSDASSLFGMLLWSSPPSISVLVGQDAEPRAFTRDWVLVHEMLHMTHPTFMPSVPWLSEGLATYFTEVARARSGRQTPERAWTELAQGFSRGRAEVGSRTMKDIVTEDDSYLGTYWTGALFALHLDVELRRLTHSEHGLETVLDRLALPGAPPTGRVASLEDFGQQVDAVAGQPLFQALLERHLRQPAFSEADALLKSLGVVSGSGGVRLVSAPDSALRQKLEARRLPEGGTGQAPGVKSL